MCGTLSLVAPPLALMQVTYFNFLSCVIPYLSHLLSSASHSALKMVDRHLLDAHLIEMIGLDDASCTCCGVNGMTAQKTIILISLFVYIGGYQVGFGPISWLLISEIFPLEVRGKAVSIAVVTNFFWNTVVTFLFPVELEYLGSSTTFYVYAGILLLSIYFIYSRVPETKGMSLEEIEDFFVQSSKISSSKEGAETDSDNSDRMNTNSSKSNKLSALI